MKYISHAIFIKIIKKKIKVAPPIKYNELSLIKGFLHKLGSGIKHYVSIS